MSALTTPSNNEPVAFAEGARETGMRETISDDLDAIVVTGISRASDDDARHDLKVGSSSAGDGGKGKKAAGFGGAEGEEEEEGNCSGNHGNAESEAPESVRHTVNAMLNVLIPAGGMLSTGFNLASTSIGAGILGLPAAFNHAGTAMAIVYLVLITAETIYSMRLLAQVADKTGLRSYEEMGVYLLHPRAEVVVAVVRALHTYGGSVAYVVTIGDLLKPILEDIEGTPEFLLQPTGRKLLQSAFWLVFMFPLVFARDFNSLRYISAFGILFIIYFAIIVIVHCCMYGLPADPRAPTRAFNTGNTALGAVGVFTFSFMCQIAALELYLESRKHSVRNFTICATISMTVCGVLYFLVGLFGYLEFGEDVKGSLLLQYSPLTEYQFLIAYIGIFVKICASFGLLNNACRCAVFPLIGWDPKTIPFRKHALGATVIAFVAFFLGIFVPNINMVFGFTGGVAGSLVGFILPALYAMYSGRWNMRSVGVVNYVCTYLTLIAGIVALVFGFSYTIYDVASS